jgi:hypothetical protein
MNRLEGRVLLSGWEGMRLGMTKAAEPKPQFSIRVGDYIPQPAHTRSSFLQKRFMIPCCYR